jgi:hypothetical protein
MEKMDPSSLDDEQTLKLQTENLRIIYANLLAFPELSWNVVCQHF